jgi:phosphate transport system permease protein
MPEVSPRTVKRRRNESRFRTLCAGAVGVTAIFLVFLIGSLAIKAWPALWMHTTPLAVMIDKDLVDPAQLAAGDYPGMVKAAFTSQFPEVTDRTAKKKVYQLLSPEVAQNLQLRVTADPTLIGKTVTLDAKLSADADLYLKGESGEESKQALGETTKFLDQLKQQGKATREFAWPLLLNGDSRDPAQAGLRGAFMGSLFTMAITLLLALPLGVAAALYLEEFSTKNRFTDFLEVNINNLAAVPSIIFGLLGLAVFLNIFGLPRSSPLVGGMVLALMVMPTIIIASRAALRAVPPSIREGALGVGASRQQAVFHHVLPLALPGILTGTILGIARALGETAPLLMIGMVAFIADIPSRMSDAATVLPVQVYLWASLPEAAFRSRTSAAILVLLLVLLCFNALAIWLRNRFERRW